MAVLVLLAVLGSGGPPLVQRGHVDVIEINRYYDGNGQLVFVQFIFWRQLTTTKHGLADYVVAWRIFNGSQPVISRRAGLALLTWVERGRLRQVFASSLIRSWTQVDPEVRNRRRLPVSRRPGL